MKVLFHHHPLEHRLRLLLLLPSVSISAPLPGPPQPRVPGSICVESSNKSELHITSGKGGMPGHFTQPPKDACF